MPRKRSPRRRRTPPTGASSPRAASGPSTGGIGWRAAIVVLAVVLTYANSLRGPFVLDDQGAIVDNQQIRQLSDLSAVLWPGRDSAVAGRPLVSLSFALNYAIGGLDVRGYRVVNVVIHAVCALLALGLIRRTLELPGLAVRLADTPANLAFAAVLLWAVHPLNSEVLNYLSQRSESMMAAFYLLTLYAARRAWTGSRIWNAVAVGACALGMLCKESMATAPLMVALYDRVFIFGSWREALRSRPGLYVGLAASWIVVLAIVLTGPRAGVAGFSSGVSPWTYLLNQAVVVARYLRLSIWPADLVVFYGWPAPLTLADVLLPGAAILALLAATVFGLFRLPPLGFLGAWFFLTLAPTSSVVPIVTEVGAERRMYLPLLAVLMAIVAGASALDRWWPLRRRLVPAAALAVAAVVLAAATVERNREYASALTLAQTVVDRRPTAVAHHILGEQLMLAGRDAEAIGPLTEAVAQGDSRAGYFLGAALSNEKRLDEALERLDAFVRTAERPQEFRWLVPPVADVASARVLMGRIFLARRQWESGAEQLERALRLRPSDADALRLLADARFGQERWQEAASLYAEYLGRQPDDSQALTSLGLTRVAVGDFDRAVDLFRRALELDPGNARAKDFLALALKDQQSAAAER